MIIGFCLYNSTLALAPLSAELAPSAKPRVFLNFLDLEDEIYKCEEL